MHTPLVVTVQVNSSAWHRRGTTYVRGQAFSDGRLHRAAELAELLDACRDATAWQRAIANLNGCFAAVTVRTTETLAAVDRVRSIPLFYAVAGREIVLSDDAQVARMHLGATGLDKLAVSEFTLTGYVTGQETLIPGLLQVRAGSILMIADAEPPRVIQESYYIFRHRPQADVSDETLIAELMKTHQGVFERLAADVGDRPLVVPLSGGFDSRLIGVALKDLGLRNVLCYTYGVAGNWEARISEELARYLGFKWTMVTYSAQKWRAWSATPEFRAYFRAAGNLASVPHIQDWPAVFELRNDGLLAPDAIFVPGHSGDFLAGSHVPKAYARIASVQRDELLDTILDAHYSLWDWPRADRAALRATMAHRVEALVEPIVGGRNGSRGTMSRETAADAFECWDWQERQAKFICNSMRVYDFFGYEWRLPLFDSVLMDYWSRAPVDQRIGRKLYFEFVRRHQTLPITEANTDHSGATRAAIQAMDALRLRPLAKTLRQAARRLAWRKQREGGSLAWLAIVEPDEFHARYTGREIGHSFFALRYLATAQDAAPHGATDRTIAAAPDTPPVKSPAPVPRFEQRWRERFIEFAALREDDAGIAGWSVAGLESRFRFFRSLWQDPPEGSRYLDVGCGAGTYSRWLAARGLCVIGVDYSHPTLVKARDRTGPEVAYCAADGSRLPFADASVDGVVCLGVLQAMQGSRPLVQELARVVRDGGVVWIDALNCHGPAAWWDRVYRRLKRKPMHLRYESRSTLRGLLLEAGFATAQSHWLPLMPSRLRRLQPAFDSRFANRLLTRVPLLGSIASHSFVFVATRRDRARGPQS